MIDWVSELESYVLKGKGGGWGDDILKPKSLKLHIRPVLWSPNNRHANIRLGDWSEIDKGDFFKLKL